MVGGIFLVQNDGKLIEMTEKEYDSEAYLQGLLADYPDLLAGNQIDPASPRRWLLVTREAGIPNSEDSGNHWSVDHLFLDQDAIPTLVEVKRSANPEIRRKIVGQMLDYAANAVSYWSIVDIRSMFEDRCAEAGVDIEKEMSDVLDADESIESIDDFWERVETNLQAGKIRTLFVADAIPRELRRVITFLNENMDRVEVLGIEIKQCTRDGHKIFVSSVIGQIDKKPPPTGKPWNEKMFFPAIEEAGGQKAEAVATQLLEWAKSKRMTIGWGRGKVSGSFVPTYESVDKYSFFAVRTDAKIEFYFASYATKPVFAPEGRRLEILDRLNKIEGVEIPRDKIKGYPKIPLDIFLDKQSYKELLAVFDWMITEIKNTQLPMEDGFHC